MIQEDYSALEERLRLLPTASPPAALREQMLGKAAARQKIRSGRKRPLVFGLCILGLLALNIGLERMQSARLGRLMGSTWQAAPRLSEKDLPMAFAWQRAAALTLLQEELR